MILYLQATTNVQDLMIDYIEVKLKSGKTVSLNWDESGIERSKTGFDARYKGVYFDEEYANGRISELAGMKIDTIGLYSEQVETPEIVITKMSFEDGDIKMDICSGVLYARKFNEGSRTHGI